MKMKALIKAIVITEQGLELRDVPKPEPKPHQVLVKVHHAGLNRADLAMAAGHKHGPAGGAGTVAGLEWSGEVAELGSAVTGYQVGDRVMCSGAGGYAEYAVADPARTNPIPTATDNPYSMAEAATLPVALQTMHDALVTNGKLQSGQTVLIQGASSGVGILGLQIAKSLGASMVVGSSTNDERRAHLLDYGADLTVDSRSDEWVKTVLNATDGQGVDVIIDQISGYVANDNLRATKVQGRIVNVGRLGGTHHDFNFDLHALRRIHYVGVTFRTRSTAEVAAINQAMRQDLWSALEQRQLRIPIAKIFPLDEAAEAQTFMNENQHFGKILLEM